MKLSIEPPLAARYPGYRMFTVVATGIDNSGDDEALRRRLAEVSAELRRREDLEDLGANPRVAAWRQAFRDFGADPGSSKPSLDGLLQRVLNRQEIPFVNKVVAISNLVSLKHLLPSGGDDLQAIEGDFGLRFAGGLERFRPIGEAVEEHPEPDEVIYADQQKVLCRRWIWRQGEESKIADETTQAAVNVDVMPPATAEEGRAAAAELAELIERHCGGPGAVETEILEIGGENLSAALSHRAVAVVTRERLKSDRVRRLIDGYGDQLSDSADMADWSIHDLLRRGNVERIVVESAFLERLEQGPISIYDGFDPTGTALHVGHMVALRALRWFQRNGHRVIFLIGDATALIGDPSGRSAEREMLTHEQVAKNMATYRRQAGQIVDFDGENPVEVLRNSEWLLPLKLEDVFDLMSRITAQRLLERDMFQVRMKKGEPLYYVETIYPLLQGYDSVAMEVDAELGGRDQLYNMLCGRDLAKSYLDKEKHVLTTPLLPGFDGRKMSKTYGNTVDLSAPSFGLYDGIMRVNDDLILTYGLMLTDLPYSELAEMEASLADDPLAVKERIASAVVAGLRGEEEARAARDEFVRVRRQGASPDALATARVPGLPAEGPLLDYLAAAEPPVAASKGELKRLIRQGGLTLGERKVTDLAEHVAAEELDGQVLRLGKKRFFQLAVG